MKSEQSEVLFPEEVREPGDYSDISVSVLAPPSLGPKHTIAARLCNLGPGACIVLDRHDPGEDTITA